MQIGKGEIADAEIVDHHSNAEFATSIQGLLDILRLLQQKPLGDLEIQPTGAGAGFIENAIEAFQKPQLVEVRG